MGRVGVTVVPLDYKLHLRRSRDASWASRKGKVYEKCRVLQAKIRGVSKLAGPPRAHGKHVSHRGELQVEDSGPVPLGGVGCVWRGWGCLSMWWVVAELGKLLICLYLPQPQLFRCHLQGSCWWPPREPQSGSLSLQDQEPSQWGRTVVLRPRVP